MATFTWTDGNGSWSVPGNWSTDSVPNSSSANVFIVDDTSTVTLSASVSVDSLQLAGGNALEVSSGSVLTVGSQIDNAGTILIAAGDNNAALDTDGTVSLTGGGTVILSNGTSGNQALISQSTSGSPLTNVDNTIEGFGQIGGAGGLALVNEGTIDANVLGQTLILSSGAGTNSGVLEATDSGALSITASVNNSGGDITADGATVAISNSAVITGGTLNTSGGGTLESVGGTETLNGVTISSGSTYTIGSGGVVQIEGTIDNAGTILIAAGDNNAALDTDGTVSLTGGGTVILSNGTSGNQALISQSTSGSPLTNVDNTIEGFGQIGGAGGLALVNEGTVDANVLGQTLILSGGAGTNSGVLEATDSGALSITASVNNSGGDITADGATVAISNSAVITGGTLNTSGGGTLESVGGTETLNGVTISSSSTYTIGSGGVVQIEGTIDNAGTILIAAGDNNAALDTDGTVSLTGGGTAILSNGTSGNQALIAQSVASSPLTNVNNTIEGSGQIGGAGGLALVNEGTVDANAPGQTLTLTLSGGGVTNLGLLEATGSGALSITTSVTNTSGNITADGATVAISNNAEITGGTLNTSGGGTLGSVGGTEALNGVTISSGSTYTVSSGSSTQLAGTIDNAGTILVGARDNNAGLDTDGPVSLTGDGTVILSNGTSGFQALIAQSVGGSPLTNVDNTIEGSGIIGNGSLALINGGVIDATPEGGTPTLTLNGSGTFVSTGTLEATGGATLALDLGAVTVSGLVSVAASSALDLTGELTVNGTLANSGAVSGGPAMEIQFGSGNDRLILGPAATFGGTVAGGGINSTIELAAGTSAGTLNALGTTFTNFGTVIVDPGATWTVDAAISLLATTTFIGDRALSTLALTNAGTFSLAGVSNFGTIDLAAGNNTVTVTDKTLYGGAVTINDGASGNNKVSAAGDTSASKNKTLIYNAGSGTDSFTGGFENDKVNVSGAAVGVDTLTGGSGTNTLTLSSAGAASLGGVSKFGTINLAASNSAVTVTDATLSGGSVTINDGASGNNTISAAGDTSASKSKALTYNAGTGTDSFTGGLENDAVHVSGAAVGGDTLTGGSGTNTLTLTSAGAANLGGVSKFGTINLAAGNSTVTVTDKTLSDGLVSINDGASGNNSISAASDTSASTGKTLKYFTGSGTDTFTGGFENDVVRVSAVAVGGDTLTAGSGANSLLLNNAGAVNLGGVGKFPTIDLAAGNSTVTVTDKTLSGGLVTINDGASGNNTVSAASDTSASKGKTLKYFTGSGTDTFTGGFENDVLRVSAAAVGGDTLTGGSGADTLLLNNAGAVNLGGVGKFPTIDLAAGNSTVTVADKTLSGGSVTISDGASGNNSISAAGDTSTSTGKTLIYFAGTGTDRFTGGFENDVLHISAAPVGGDTLTGGSGVDTLVLTSAGAANLGGVGKFPTIDLAAGNSTVTVTDKTLSGGLVTINDGASGNNTVSAASDTSASTGKTLKYFTGSGTDTFAGGFENDVVRISAAAVGGDTLTGGSGANSLLLNNAGAVNLGGVSKFPSINLAAGNSTVTVTDKTLSGELVTINDGASGNNSTSAASDTSASTGKTLKYFTGSGTDTFTGGFENDVVRVSAAAVGGDTLTAGSGANSLLLNNAGAVNLRGVGKFPTIDLAAGNSRVTVTDRTLSGGLVTINDGASGNNTVSAASDTSASTGKTLKYFTGSGTDTFTGGFENDAVHVSAAAVGGDTLTGGSGANSLLLTNAGAANLGGVSKFGTINLAAGNSTVTVTDATLSGGSVTINDGASGNNTISAAGDTSASTGKSLTYHAGPGTNGFTGGFENDTIYAGTGSGTYTAGSGNDSFVFIKSSLPSQTLNNFQVSTDDILVYGTHSAGGFDLGSTDNALNPTTPTAIDVSIFVTNASGDFTSSSQRFAYDTTNGDLFYSATGSNSSESLVAHLTGEPGFTPSNLLFEH